METGVIISPQVDCETVRDLDINLLPNTEVEKLPVKLTVNDRDSVTDGVTDGVTA